MSHFPLFNRFLQGFLVILVTLMIQFILHFFDVRFISVVVTNGRIITGTKQVIFFYQVGSGPVKTQWRFGDVIK
jgi:hypothetical protein